MGNHSTTESKLLQRAQQATTLVDGLNKITGENLSDIDTVAPNLSPSTAQATRSHFAGASREI